LFRQRREYMRAGFAVDNSHVRGIDFCCFQHSKGLSDAGYLL
jgi:hypothetical protein